MYFKNIVQSIFSVYNEDYFKVFCVLGLRIKFFSISRYNKYRMRILEWYYKKYRLSDRAKQLLESKISLLETRGFRLKKYEKYLMLSNKRLQLLTNRYTQIAKEVFYDELYDIPSALLNTKKQYCVLDIGANRCYTALYFADKKWCNRIDSFEIIPDTYQLALKNININKKYLKDKIHLYNIGLGAENKEVECFYMPNRDGIATVDINWLKSYAPTVVDKAKHVMCKVVKASTFLKNLIQEHNISNIILKIDVEGAEYEILQDLADNYPKIFDKIELMIGDTHCGFEKFLRIISPFGYTIVAATPEENGSCPFILIKHREKHA